MARMYYEKDCDLNKLNGKKIAIIGYGSQGHAHAMNLKDSGCDVCVGLRAGSKNWAAAEKAGLKVMTVADAAKWGNIVMILINDEVQAEVYTRISYLSGSQMDHYTVPSLISRMTTDTHHVHRTVGMLQRMGVRAPILVLGGIIMTLALDPALCLVLCCMMPLMTVMVLMVSKKGLPLFDKLQKSVDELVRVVRENTTGVRVIKALSRVNAEKERFNEVNTRVMRDERRANVTMALTRPSTSLILNFGLVLVAIFCRN